MATRRAKNVITTIMHREGGFVDHPMDRGGPTKYGITLSTLSAYRGYMVEADDIKQLTQDQAFEIYHDEFWLNYRYGELPPPADEYVMDMAVHSGPTAAHRILQRSVWVAGDVDIEDDGILGPNTRECALSSNVRLLMASMRGMRLDRLHWIVETDPDQRVFLDGWISRALS
jgi:lysozyme family protein